MIVWSAEFCVLIKETTRIADKLQSTGQLLQFVVFPVQETGSWINPRYKRQEVAFDAYALEVDIYLIE